MTRRWPSKGPLGRLSALVVGIALAALALGNLVGGELFVLTEARALIQFSPPIDWLRLALLPELTWGEGRLGGVAMFWLTGAICGVDSGCVGAAGALLTALGAAVLTIHGWQVSRSRVVAVVAALAWTFSAPVLAVLLWQAARYDMLALVGAITTSALWWAVLGRPALALRGRVAFVGASLLLLALSLNAKESAYYLLAALPLIVLLRSDSTALLRRNLLLATLPLAYGAYFVAFALTHVQSDYAQYATGEPILRGLSQLLLQSLGVSGLIYIEQSGPTLEVMRLLARVGYGVFAVALLLAAIWIGISIFRSRRRQPAVAAAATTATDGRGQRARRVLADIGPELYLALVGVGLTLFGARSAGASAHYMVIPYWAGALLLLMVVRRGAGRLPRPRLAAALLLALAVLPASVAYTSQFIDRSAYRQLHAASVQVHELGTQVRMLLAGRPVETVHWRTLGAPAVGFFVLRSGALDTVDDDIWPFLVGDVAARPDVRAIAAGTTPELRQRIAEFAAPGVVLLVIDERYRLVLLAHAGTILFEDEAGQLTGPNQLLVSVRTTSSLSWYLALPGIFCA